MTDDSITPPLELVQQWDDEGTAMFRPEYQMHLANRAAQWGADQQLAKDAEWLNHNALNQPHLRIAPVGKSLKEAMRHKPLSLKEQALETLKYPKDFWSEAEVDTIRLALEALSDD